MRVASVVGARPQFVKAALLSREFRRGGIGEHLIHTGQHYDVTMSEVFFEQLGIPDPEVNLGVGSASHAVQTAEIMMRLEPVVERLRPDALLVYGDTNSTLAGALVGSKLDVPVVHVEAGLRSHDRSMPEEINRVVTDHVSELLLAPGTNAREQLEREGITRPIEVVGDLMVDLAVEASSTLPARPEILERFGLKERRYALATIHRSGNTDNPATFAQLLLGLRAVGLPVLFPVHPRTRPLVERYSAGEGDGIIVSEPLPYLDTIALQRYAAVVITDSGGMQKEAVTLGTPCVTLRDETEWPETLEEGWNVLAGSDPDRIARAARRSVPSRFIALFGEGQSAQRIITAMRKHLGGFRKEQQCVSSF
jgi:UDP-GlcNAc3NAcA epimerase